MAWPAHHRHLVRGATISPVLAAGLYWVRTSATRRGVATAAVRALTEFAFRETNLVRLEIVVALGNVASHRVAGKVGALREGVAHDRLYAHGQSHHAIISALLRSRYGERAPGV
jgi:RimJ/RimL family protein N-acetyltransferase